jgi:uncharacterized protein (DUF1499 family)
MQFLTYLNLVLLILGPLGSHFHWISPIFGFSLFSFGVFLSAILFFPAVVGFFRWGLREANKLTIFMGIISLAGIGYTAKLVIENPISDVSTDSIRPPEYHHLSYRFKVPEEFKGKDPTILYDKTFSLESAAQLTTVYPHLKPLEFADSPVNILEALENTVTQLPKEWKVVFVNRVEPLAIELENESELFRFVDDVVIEVRVRTNGPGSEVHFRSKSRYGKSDLGANFSRIQKLSARLAGISQPAPQNPTPTN